MVIVPRKALLLFLQTIRADHPPSEVLRVHVGLDVADQQHQVLPDTLPCEVGLDVADHAVETGSAGLGLIVGLDVGTVETRRELVGLDLVVSLDVAPIPLVDRATLPAALGLDALVVPVFNPAESIGVNLGLDSVVTP